jgi:hypothetical protein
LVFGPSPELESGGIRTSAASRRFRTPPNRPGVTSIFEIRLAGLAG